MAKATTAKKAASSSSRKLDMAKDKKLGIREGSKKDKKRDKKVKGY